MLKVNLAVLHAGEVEVDETIPADDPMWEDAGIEFRSPVRVHLRAQEISGGVYVRGGARADLLYQCRRCVEPVILPIEEELSFFFARAEEEEDPDAGDETYPLPPKGDELELTDPVREQLLLRIPRYMVCREECRGLCPQCGADLNPGDCGCVPAPVPGPWDALKNVKFD